MALLWSADGSRQPVRCAQRDAHALLGGPLTIVGAVPEVDAVIVARREPDDAAPPHPFFRGQRDGGQDVRGDVLVVASDADGAEMDLDLGACLRCLAGRTPDGANGANGANGAAVAVAVSAAQVAVEADDGRAPPP